MEARDGDQYRYWKVQLLGRFLGKIEIHICINTESCVLYCKKNPAASGT